MTKMSPAAHRYRFGAMKLGGNEGVSSDNSFAIWFVGCDIWIVEAAFEAFGEGILMIEQLDCANEWRNGECDELYPDKESG